MIQVAFLLDEFLGMERWLSGSLFRSVEPFANIYFTSVRCACLGAVSAYSVIINRHRFRQHQPMDVRRYYTWLWLAAPFFIRRYLRRRARKAPAYLAHWGERFGEPMEAPVTGALWIHAVSVGETRAAQPLIQALRLHFPELPLLLTQMTPTGRATAQALYPEVQCRYLPYDKPEYINRFLREHRPRFGILMETEIWPNLIHGCAEHDVPLFLANARLSEKSLQGYLKIRALVAPALQTLSGCYAQTAADAERLHFIGASKVYVCGNTKYDITPPAEMHERAQAFKHRLGERPVVVCASTRVYKDEDEAALLLRAWKSYRGNALLVLVPRHPEQFQKAFDTAMAFGFKTQKRSDNEAVRPDTQVWIGDSMGELFAYYLSADMAFVGGSLVDAGCQNIIEPIACHLPTLFGPSTYNFADVCAGALQAGAARQVDSADAWFREVKSCLDSPLRRNAYVHNASSFIGLHQGASQRMAERIAEEMRGLT